MSDYGFNEEETESQEVFNGPKALRDLVERQKADLKAVTDEMNALRSRVREAELGKAFTAKGLPEKAMGLFPKDVEPTDEKITEWVSQYGDLFGMSKQGETSQGTQANESAVQTPPAVPNEAQSQFQQMSAVSTGAAPMAGNPAYNDLQKAIANPNLHEEMSLDEWRALLRRAGEAV